MKFRAATQKRKVGARKKDGSGRQVEVGQAVIFFVGRAVILPSHAKVQRQIRGCAPLVAHIPPEIVPKPKTAIVTAYRLARGRKPEEVICKTEPRRCKIVRVLGERSVKAVKTHRETRRMVLKKLPSIVSCTQIQGVPFDDFGQIQYVLVLVSQIIFWCKGVGIGRRETRNGDVRGFVLPHALDTELLI